MCWAAPELSECRCADAVEPGPQGGLQWTGVADKLRQLRHELVVAKNKLRAANEVSWLC